MATRPKVENLDDNGYERLESNPYDDENVDEAPAEEEEDEVVQKPKPKPKPLVKQPIQSKPKEVLQVVEALPAQTFIQGKREDGTIVNYETPLEALSKIRMDVEAIRKAVGA